MDRRALYATILTAALCGCFYRGTTVITTVPLEDIPTIEPGITLSGLADLLADKTFYRYRAAQSGHKQDAFMASLEPPLTHQFTLFRDDNAVLCATSTVIQPSFCFVFRNDRLEKILRRSFGRRNRDPVQLLERVLEAEGLSTEAFVAIVTDQIELNARYQRAMEPVPLPFFFPMLFAAQLRPDQLRHAELQAKYNPLKIQLGMSSLQVQELLGTPVIISTISEHEVVRVYGKDAVTEGLPDALVSVTYEDDRAIAIHSHAFLDPSLRRTAINAIQDSSK